MPATVRDQDQNGADSAASDVPEGAEEQQTSSVTGYLDMALQAARDEDMSASELMGLLFYYAHSIAEGYRQDILSEMAEEGGG